MVDMKAKPFYLSDEDCKWVEETIAGMTTEEKIGQLFFNMGSSRDEEYLKMTVDKYHIGGIRYNPATGAEVREQNRILQENSKIPLIIACNTENGGNGACTDGTMIGQQTKIGATRDARYAYELGRMSNKEAAAIGCNLSFAPVSDILYNWENPVIGLRTYGNDVDRVCADPIRKLGHDERFIGPALLCLKYGMLPYFLAGFLRNVTTSEGVIAVAEACVRMILFLGYLVLISRMKDIQRVFMYHGAEHKCINCVEHGLELNVENVMKSSREHKRCGTSFLLFVMIVSIIFFLFIRVSSPVLRVVIRLLLMPVIAGVSYEIIRLAGKSDNKIVALLSKPGLMLQHLTTREPEPEMAEVAIAAVEAVFDWRSYLKENFPEQYGEKS